MRRLLPVLAAVLLLVAGLSVASRVFSPAVGSSAAPCGDPTASCWANGRPPIYLAKVQQRSIDPAEPYATIVSRLLNTGPNIPRLIAAAPLAGFGRIHAATATLATAEGVRSVNVQRIDRARMVLWNLGPVPNGAIVTFTIRADFPPDPTAIAYPTFYAALPAVGLPPDSSRIRNDTAPLATAASRPVKTPAAAAPTLTSVPFAGELTFPPLSRSSLYWLNFGSGFHLVLPRSSARFSEVSAARAAVNVASVGKQKATVLEAGLRTLIQQYQNFPTLTGRTFWVFSLQPANPRIHARWFFVLVDAQNGRVARIYDQLTVVGLSGHVPGEPPLVHLPGVPSAQQAMMGLLLYGSARRPLVSRQEAIALARQMSFALGGAASPAANPRANAVLARPWPFDSTLDWFVTQRVFRSARGGRRSPAIQLVRVDALTGKLVSSFCCFTPAGASP